MKFRKDINGIRAIAVIAVVIFHFNADWLPGGFAGVDVFFVISGFLMTGIIFRGIEHKNFSLFKFYISRANRIIPALAFLCFVLLIFGWFYLTPIDYKALGKHIVSSLGFFSNIVYWRESGYFDASSHGKWLIHTWSLSTEWQFYIIYPVVLVIMQKFISIELLKRTVLIGTILGLVFCSIATYKWPDPSYYLLPTRVWEMTIGGLAYLYPFSLKERNKKLFEAIGLFLIIFSYISFSDKNFWPGYLSIFPVIGTFCIIQAQRKVSFVTGNFIFQKLGTCSYSIYLWHWPITVAIYTFSLDGIYVFLGLALSILLGSLSYRYIEKFKFKNDFIKISSYLRSKPILMVVGISFISGLIFISNGAIFRLSKNLQEMNRSAISAVDDWDYPKYNLKIEGIDVRFIKGTTKKNILFIGASHIEQTYPYSYSSQSKYNIYYVTKNGCFLTKSYKNPHWSCSNIQNYKNIINTIKFDKIVTSMFAFDGYLSKNSSIKKEQIKQRIIEYNEFLYFAKSNSNKVFMILGEPKGLEFDPLQSIRHNLRKFITQEEARENYQLHYDALGKLDQINNINILDPIDYLCEEICKVMDNDFNYYYKDSTHMRSQYAKKALGYLDSILLE
ncbi:acyltransferase family protein [Psychromonas arctica]|uniref:Acyltransferase family protein n=1 Tax=Psychromonas arctica TaxID=168275 RepID=A0ABU9HG28_9GAMM